MIRDRIIFFLNDQRIEVEKKDIFWPTARYLREVRGLTGTKIVCEEGDCGACTVLVTDEDNHFQAVDCCILPVYALDGRQLISVEGLKTPQGELHPVQQSMIDNFGSQCGFCTPGFVCAMTALCENSLRQKKAITEKRARNALTGNLCRCTGYEPILKAATTLDLTKVTPLAKRYQNPALLQEMKSLRAESVIIDKKLFLPATLSEAIALKAENPKARILGGATDLGVLQNKGKFQPTKIISLQNIPELHVIKSTKTTLEIGARVTFTQSEKFFEKAMPELANLLKIFASPQIKNIGTWVGNAANASPIGDSIPFLLVAEAEIIAQSQRGTRAIPIDSFYQGYKKLDLLEDEIVTSIHIPLKNLQKLTKLYKTSTRKDLDISTVTLAVALDMKKSKVIDQVRIAVGGVGPTAFRLKDLEKKWTGKVCDQNLIENAVLDLSQMIQPLSDVRGSKEFRLLLCQNLFRQFYAELP